MSPRAKSMRALLAGVLLLAAAGAAARPVAPPEHRRGAEQTFLTYPEWFLVHSPAEYAAFVKSSPPSEFPFWGHVCQLWQSYGAVTRATTNERYPFNFGYHVMIMVIGVSTTVEYALRSAYETLVGRLAELARTHGPTPEDAYATRIAQDYVDFIRERPWYEYDFWGKLKGLWRETSLVGPDLLRKWERKYALTSEYGAKAIYGWLIMKATKASYDEALPVTAVVLDRLPDGAAADVKLLQTLPDGGALVTVPRYAAFKSGTTALARRGANFREIAGNEAQAEILVSVLVPVGWQPPVSDARALFIQPLITQPGVQRVAFTVPVGSLAELLRRLDAAKTAIEHVYDY